MGGMPFVERAFAASRRLWGGSEDGWLRSVDGRAAVRFRSANNTNIYCWISRGPAIANKDERTQLRYHHDIAWKARLTIKVAVFEKGIDPSIYPCGWQAMRHRPRSCGTKGKKSRQNAGETNSDFVHLPRSFHCQKGGGITRARPLKK